MWTYVFILAGVMSALQLKSLLIDVREDTHTIMKEEKNGVDGTLKTAVNYIVETYGLPFAHYCITRLYMLYVRFTLVNVIVFVVKYVPAVVYMYKFIKDIYLRSRKRINDKKIELEDIRLQIQIVDTMLSEKDVEFRERAEHLRLAVERLRLVRGRVREAIASDESLRRVLDSTVFWDADHDMEPPTYSNEEDRETIIELLKELMFDHAAVPIWPAEKAEFTKKAQSEHNTPENSVYSSLSDVDMRQDCRVRIVRVTNVYKVACLKHYIKQKRLRRATKHTTLKKKMDTIKKLLDDWQKALNMVINTKLTIIDSHPLDVASQDAMGDYSKPREFTDSNNEFINHCPDMFYDDFQSNWIQNPYKSYMCNYEQEDPPKEYYDSEDLVDVKYQQQNVYRCELSQVHNMKAIIEETNSQVAIEEVKEEEDDDDCEYRD